MVLLLPAALLLALPAGQDTTAQDTQLSRTAPEGDEVEEVVIRSDLPRCYARRDDPLEQVDFTVSGERQSVVKRDAGGNWRVLPDDDPITGEGVWQRAGRNMQNYVWRPPVDGSPMCISSIGKRARGFAQFRQVYDARPYHGKYVRFTAFVATRRGHEVRFWLAGGDGFRAFQGGDTANQPLTGTHGNWVPVSLVMGPMDKGTTKISMGFLLMGRGIVWVTQPKFEEIGEDEAKGRAGPAFNKKRNLRSSIPQEP